MKKINLKIKKKTRKISKYKFISKLQTLLSIMSALNNLTLLFLVCQIRANPNCRTIPCLKLIESK
jgi:hypothetical protein